MITVGPLDTIIPNLGWSEFLRQLGYKTSWSGSTLVEAGRFYPSSKTCSGCGARKVDLELSERTYVCGSCGLVLDRDLNAAINLRPVAVTPTETPTADRGIVSPGTVWQIPVKSEPSTEGLAA